MKLEAQTDGAQVKAEGQDPDHVGAHDGRRQFVFNGAVGVLVGAQQLEGFAR